MTRLVLQTAHRALLTMIVSSQITPEMHSPGKLTRLSPDERGVRPSPFSDQKKG